MNKYIKCLAVLGLTASLAFAHETVNKTGLLGVNKTHSAKSMKHGQLGISLLGDINNDGGIVDGGFTTVGDKGLIPAPTPEASRDKYLGLSGYVGMAFGMFEIVDLAVMLPVYYDQQTFKHADAAKKGGLGNLRANLKLRAPLPEDQIFDVALILGGDFGTANTDERGIWLREPDYYNLEKAASYSFGHRQTIFRAVLAASLDLRKIDAAPLLVHLNGGYRMPIGGDGYNRFYHFSAGLEVYPLPVVSIFGEYYMDIPDGKMGDYVDLSEASVGLVFHIGSHLDIQVGGHFYIGGDKYAPMTGAFGHDTWFYNGRVNPTAAGFGGITWSGFLIDPDRDGDTVIDEEDKCPDEVGSPQNDGCPWSNPDLDEDGICDAWVAEKGLFGEFADLCEGIDNCPNEAGEGEDGCPLDEPDADKDGVCDAWVSQKGYQDHFKDICGGIDNCPAQPGPETNMGCPEDNPDADGDGMCDPWVSQKNRVKDFAKVCKGYDQCPGEAGPDANKGCPWPDPDTDGDGLCDEWVTAKKMGYFFENAATLNDPYVTKACKGLDKCPYEYGPLFTDGCPAEDPDPDKDGVCDAWVTQQKVLDQFAEVCSGLDKCPLDSGSVENHGCKLDDPDQDKDGVCDAWVTEKKMLDKYLEVCSGFDKCPYDAGDKDNQGCPLDDPDTDKDGVCDPWVTQKKMSKKFQDVCVGVDNCPLEAGDKNNNGCEIKLKVMKLDGVTFASGKSVLNSNAKKALKGTIRELKLPENEGTNIVIQGHTDNTGNAKKNKKLSLQRAQAVMKYLISQGIDKKRVKAIGCGADAPIASNKTADGREENRRIEMHPATPEGTEEQCIATYTEDE